MRPFFKTLLAAWLTGCVLGCGCFCGMVGAGMLVPKRGPSEEYKFVQAQIVEIQQALESLYEPISAGCDEMAGLE